jgi:hypothetical protein
MPPLLHVGLCSWEKKEEEEDSNLKLEQDASCSCCLSTFRKSEREGWGEVIDPFYSMGTYKGGECHNLTTSQTIWLIYN